MAFKDLDQRLKLARRSGSETVKHWEYFESIAGLLSLSAVTLWGMLLALNLASKPLLIGGALGSGIVVFYYANALVRSSLWPVLAMALAVCLAAVWLYLSPANLPRWYGVANVLVGLIAVIGPIALFTRCFGSTKP